MDLLLTIPVTVRLVLLFVLGTTIGGQLNRGIYQLAWNPRDIGPWSPLRAGGSPRGGWARVPIIGWWFLRHESSRWGGGYWIRPLLLELLTGVGLAWLYWWEVERQAVWPGAVALPPDAWTLHVQYVSHLVLISLMIVATFIDLDEQTIPDAITLPGTVAGVVLAALVPLSLLPTLSEPAFGMPSVHAVVLTSSNTADGWRNGLGGPASWPLWLDGLGGLLLGWSIMGAWCLAVLHKTWTTRHGFRQAVRYLVASVLRRGTWRVPLVLGGALSLVIAVAWWMGGDRWESTLSSVVGLAGGGALIWTVRLVGGRALQMEAMGFGDVTLMAMIGAFLGWQATFLIFFMAPFSALVIALTQWALSGDRQIAFGPYLCLSAVILLVNWNAIWTDWARVMFSFGWFIPAMFACCLVLMGGLLMLWRIVRDTLLGDPSETWEEP